MIERTSPPCGWKLAVVAVSLLALTVVAPGAALAQSSIAIEKEFLDDPVRAGDVVTLEFMITNNSSTSDLISVSFSDDLSFLTGLVVVDGTGLDVCGAGSFLGGSTVLDLSSGSIPAGQDCTFEVTLQVPYDSLEGAHANTTSTVTGFLVGTGFVDGPPATDDLDVTPAEPLKKTFLNDPVLPGATVPLEFVLTNEGSEALSGIAFSDDLTTVVTDLAATNLPLFDICGSGSSLTGTTELVFSAGYLDPGLACSFTVDLLVPAGASSGSYLNVTSEVSFTYGESEGEPEPFGAPAEDVLEIGIPKLEKSFTDDPVLPGDTVTLEFTITNVNQMDGFSGLEFDDDLEAVLPGLTAQGLPLADVCGTGSTLEDQTPMEPMGASVIGLVDGNLGAGESCTFSVTLSVPGGASAGDFVNTTSGLLIGSTEDVGSPASDTLQILGVPEFSKSFVDDPTAPGTAVTLEFTITNTDPVRRAGEISFTDDLDAVLSGLVAPDLIASPLLDVCGPGSVLSGPSLMTLTGGNLDPLASCTFAVTLLVPGGTLPGTYANVTSELSAEIGSGGGRLGTPVVQDPAADDLVVAAIPLLTKSFTDDPVLPGGTVSLEFTIFNTDTLAAATDISFTDDLHIFTDVDGIVLTPLEAIALPPDDFCGAGSTLVGTDVLTMAAGNLPAGGSCTFSATLQVPTTVTIEPFSPFDPPYEAPLRDGSYLNTTSAVTATINAEAVAGGPASDPLLVVTRPRLSKVFVGPPVDPGATVELQFTVTNASSTVSATELSFADDLTAVTTGLAAVDLPLTDVCGPGSRLIADGGDPSQLLLVDGVLPPEGVCTFAAALQVPGATAPGVYPNITSDLTGSIGGLPVTGLPATADLLIASDLLLFSKSFTDDPVLADQAGTQPVTLEFVITNNDPVADATAITFQDQLSDVLPGLVVTSPTLPLADVCGDGSILVGNVTVILINGNLLAGESCTITLTLEVPAGVPAGSFRNATTVLTATIGGNPESAPPAIDDLIVLDQLSLLKEFTDDPVLPGATATLEFTIDWADPSSPAENIAFTDDLAAVIPGLAAVGLPPDGFCGVGSQITGTTVLSFTGGTLGTLSSCTFSVTLEVPEGTLEGSYLNTTSEITGDVGGTEGTLPVAINGDPASDSLQVAGIPVLAKVFIDDPAAPGASVSLQFTITNNNTVAPATLLTFTDDLEALVPGLVATALPQNDVCGTGSVLSGTSVIELTDGELTPNGSCSFTVTLDVPAGANPGIHPNVTSALTGEVGGTPILGNVAATNLLIEALPLLEKSFIDDPVTAAGTVTLEFTVTNTDLVEPATGLGFTDDLDAVLSGLVATGNPQNDVCGAGSTLTGTSLLTLSGGNLAAGGSCTFSVTLPVPADAPPGSYPNITSTITGLVGGNSLEGQPATDDLVITEGPRLQKSFANDPVAPGDTVELEFLLTMGETLLSATGLEFTDDLDAVLPGLVALGLPISDICGDGSELTGTSTLAFTGGTLDPGASCLFSITLQVPASASFGSYPNATSTLTGLLDGSPFETDPAVDDLLIESGLSLEKSFTDNPAVPGGLVTLEFTLANIDPVLTATEISFTDDLEAVLTGLMAVGLPASDVCGTGSTITGTSLLTLTDGTLPPLGSCTFSVTLQVPGGAIPAEYPNTTSPATALLGGDPVGAAPGNDTLLVSQGLVLEKTFLDDPVSPGGAVDLEFTISYLGVVDSVSDLEFTDDLEAVLSGLVATTLPADGFCGPGSQLTGTSLLALSGGSLAPSTSCTFQATLQVPTTAPAGGFDNTTSEISGLLGDVEGTPIVITGPPATDRLDVIAGLGFEKLTNGLDADEIPGPTLLVNGAVTWEYVVTNDTGAQLTDIVVSDDQGVSVSCPSDTLAPAATLICTATGIAIEGQYANVGAVTGVSADRTITETDLSHYFGLPVDFGDAPPTFPTLLVDDGARHIRLLGIHLGAAVDLEPDGLPTPTADGDDISGIDDEDGVTFTSAIVAGTDADVEVTATTPGLLNAWIDFNGDGDWDDAGEQIFTDLALAAGANPLVVALPPDAETGSTFSRWRFSTGGGLGVTGEAPDGEVEDHVVDIVTEADLALEKEDVWDPRMAGKPQTYVLTITNDGPSLARDVYFEDTIPVETVFISVEPGSPTCFGVAGVLTCELGDLDVGAVSEVRFDVFIDPTFEGTMVNDAFTSSDTVDPNPGNDSTTEDTTVLALMDLVALPDVNGNNASDVAVLQPGSLEFTVVDGSTGAVISSDTFEPNYEPIAMSEVANFADSAAPELAILALRPSDGEVTVFIRDSGTGTALRDFPVNSDYSPLYLATVPDFADSPADEVAVLARRYTDGMPRVFVLDADSGRLIRGFNFPRPYFPLAMEVVPDFSGGGIPEIAVVGRRGTDRAVQVTMRDAAAAAIVAQWFSDRTFQPLGLANVPAWDGGVDRVALLGRRSADGAVRLFIRQVTDGTLEMKPPYGHNASFLPMDLEVVMDFAGPVADETTVLRWRPADGDTRMSLKDASDGTFLLGIKSDPTYYPLDLELQPDWASTLTDELAILGVRLTDGDLKVFLFNAGNGLNLGPVTIP